MTLKKYLKESNYLAQIISRPNGCELVIPERKLPWHEKARKILYKIDDELNIISKSEASKASFSTIESTPYSNKLFLLLDTNIECQKSDYPLDLIEYKNTNNKPVDSLDEVLGLKNTINNTGLELALTTIVFKYYDDPTAIDSLKVEATKCGVGIGFDKFCSYFVKETQ